MLRLVNCFRPSACNLRFWVCCVCNFEGLIGTTWFTSVISEVLYSIKLQLRWLWFRIWILLMKFVYTLLIDNFTGFLGLESMVFSSEFFMSFYRLWIPWFVELIKLHHLFLSKCIFQSTYLFRTRINSFVSFFFCMYPFGSPNGLNFALHFPHD